MENDIWKPYSQAELEELTYVALYSILVQSLVSFFLSQECCSFESFRSVVLFPELGVILSFFLSFSIQLSHLV